MKLMGKVRPPAEKDSNDRAGSQGFLDLHHFPIYAIFTKVLEMLRWKGNSNGTIILASSTAFARGLQSNNKSRTLTDDLL